MNLLIKSTPISRMDQYLQELVESQRVPKQEIKEFYCNTCRSNLNMEKLDQFEKSKVKLTFIPSGVRKVLRKVGIVFTQSSYLYMAHKNQFNHHEWAEYQPTLQKA